MKIYTETSLKDFEFWSGAKQTASRLTDEEFDLIESYLEEASCEGEGYSETAINDLFWFEDELIAEIIGITVDELFEREPRW